MKPYQMAKRVTTLSVLASLSLLVACSSESNKAVTAGGASGTGGATGTGGASNAGGVSGGPDANLSTTFPACPSSDPSYICNPSGFPFVQLSLAVSDLCNGPVASCALGNSVPTGETSAILSQPVAGTLCLSGVVSPGGWAQLALGFSEPKPDGTGILRKFDASALGISQVQFTIDTPPSSGLVVDAAITISDSCPSNPLDCFTNGFELMTAPGSSVAVNITTSGTVPAPFANFKQTVNGHGFDTSALDHMSLNLSSQGPFNFCIHDFKFHDALGNEVRDTQQ